MRKVYRYRDLFFPVSDNEDVIFTVEFVTDGNMAHTVVNVPGDKDPEIEDEGSAFLGKGRHLRGDTTISFSDVANLAAEEDTITINYRLNGHLLQTHTNPKTETDRPFVVLFIKFPEA